MVITYRMSSFKKRTDQKLLTKRTSNLINDLNHLEVYFFSGGIVGEHY